MPQPFALLPELAEFIAALDPAKVASFCPSPESQNRLDFLLTKQKEKKLTDAEEREIRNYLIINRLMSLSKAYARQLLQSK